MRNLKCLKMHNSCGVGSIGYTFRNTVYCQLSVTLCSHEAVRSTCMHPSVQWRMGGGGIGSWPPLWHSDKNYFYIPIAPSLAPLPISQIRHCVVLGLLEFGQKTIFFPQHSSTCAYARIGPTYPTRLRTQSHIVKRIILVSDYNAEII